MQNIIYNRITVMTIHKDDMKCKMEGAAYRWYKSPMQNFLKFLFNIPT